MELMNYEMLIRRAFGLATGESVGRWGDPAAMANAGTAETTDKTRFREAKAAAVYAMSIIKHRLEKDGKLAKKLEDMLDRNICAAFDARDSRDLIGACEEVLRQVIIPVYNPQGIAAQ